ncbi:hypothetical protein M501DRAFT_1031355 [Patellaria atrata CBS 101060]|uniref:Uncharacterized protein n=1 Tax=Patellaria atrata CBS 101060 TaxID=1346257 RepID=A0A9P4SB88_9PEZI|nr:hypothetical protein M501DRAFT_1031355 [Patellaria atrata CBS 101060]
MIPSLDKNCLRKVVRYLFISFSFLTFPNHLYQLQFVLVQRHFVLHFYHYKYQTQISVIVTTTSFTSASSMATRSLSIRIRPNGRPRDINAPNERFGKIHPNPDWMPGKSKPPPSVEGYIQFRPAVLDEDVNADVSAAKEELTQLWNDSIPTEHARLDLDFKVSNGHVTSTRSTKSGSTRSSHSSNSGYAMDLDDLSQSLRDTSLDDLMYQLTGRECSLSSSRNDEAPVLVNGKRRASRDPFHTISEPGSRSPNKLHKKRRPVVRGVQKTSPFKPSKHTSAFDTIRSMFAGKEAFPHKIRAFSDSWTQLTKDVPLSKAIGTVPVKDGKRKRSGSVPLGNYCTEELTRDEKDIMGPFRRHYGHAQVQAQHGTMRKVWGSLGKVGGGNLKGGLRT